MANLPLTTATSVLSGEAVLDILSIRPRLLSRDGDIMRVLARLDADPSSRERVLCAETGPSEETIHLRAHLEALLPTWERTIPRLHAFMTHLRDHLNLDWSFASCQGCDLSRAPTMSADDAAALSLTELEINALLHLGMPQITPALLDLATIRRTRAAMCAQIPSAERPFALVTIGGPGSGKSHVVLKNAQVGGGMEVLAARGYGGQRLQHINPDVWLKEHCANDNNCSSRVLVNLLNHETFTMAIRRGRQRCSLVHLAWARGGGGASIVAQCGLGMALRCASTRVE
jgi:hypothetical protein